MTLGHRDLREETCLGDMVSFVVTYENPPVLPDHRHPDIVSCISGEMVLVKLDRGG